MNLIPSLLFMFCLFLSTNVSFAHTPIKQLLPDRDEQSIYELIINQYQGELVIFKNTACKGIEDSDKLWKYFCKPSPLKDPEIILFSYRSAFENLKKRAKHTYRLQQWNNKITFIKSDYSQIDAQTTLFQFSPIGFNPQKTSAIVYRVGHQGTLAGDGGYFFLKKHQDHWKIDGYILTEMF